MEQGPASRPEAAAEAPRGLGHAHPAPGAERLRDLAQSNFAIDSKLRGCDLVALRIDDVLLSGRIRPQAMVLQRKTGRLGQFELTELTREAAMRWISQGGRRSGASTAARDAKATSRDPVCFVR